MTDVMMALGDYRFAVDTAAYQTLQRVSQYRWSAQARVGQRPALQFVGEDTEQITLDGIVYPQWRGGAGQLDAMRSEAGRGQPLILVDGRGNVHGRWVITRVSEDQSLHVRGGTPRRQSFSLTIKRYDDGS